MARLECSFAELDAIGAALRLNLWRFPFAAPHFGAHGQEARHAAAKTALETRGLINGVRFTPQLEDTLTVFANGPVSIAITGTANRRPIIALAVALGKRGALAVHNETRIAFSTVAADRIARAAVSLLPALRPGPGASITVATGREAPKNEHTYLRSARPTADHGSRAAQALLTRPRLGGGSFLIGSTARPDARETISWLDTDAGRHAVTSAKTSDGTLHTTYTPADQSRLDQFISRTVAKFT